ncbi:hypothetical protein HA402_008022 [Bradysia odoriphaga]|nr:hypothetical protein HA402_008022 [Bradysia odoriphaga]
MGDEKLKLSLVGKDEQTSSSVAIIPMGGVSYQSNNPQITRSPPAIVENLKNGIKLTLIFFDILTMGRNKNDKGVREVYVYDDSLHKSVCSICKSSVPGMHLGNLRNHLKRKHLEVFQSFGKSEMEENEPSPPRKKVKITVEYEKEELLDAWIDLVTVEGRPFRILDSKSLRSIVKPLFDAFDLNLLTSETVGEAILQRAERKREEIRRLLNGKVIHLKIDSATRHRHRVVGINVQVIVDGKIVVKTLSAEEMKTTHTGTHIKNHVLKVLKRFNIELIQVYSVTQDNGKNFVCAANMMTYLESPEFDDYDDDYEETEVNALNEEAFDLNEFALLGVQVIRCVAHTLNLAVEDTLDESILKDLLKKVRGLCQHLRTPVIAEQIRAAKLNQAQMDNITRWNSKYDMVLSVKRLREFCSNQNITMLTDPDWNEVDTFLEVFKPAKIASKRFQHSQLCTGDFFKHWLDLGSVLTPLYCVLISKYSTLYDARNEFVIFDKSIGKFLCFAILTIFISQPTKFHGRFSFGLMLANNGNKLEMF